MDPFSEIRPYNDAEVQPVLRRLLADREFLAVMSRLRLPRAPQWAIPLLRPWVAMRLRQQLRGVDSVAALQQVVKVYLDAMIESHINAFSQSGVERLAADQAYVLISNHRDIALDPAMVNYALYKNGLATARIAIGDNLLSKQYAADLMRLNKSFVVRRSVTAPRAMFAALKQLSKYIAHSVLNDRSSVWIAQREGRAKDGWDKTEAALIKMLCMHKAKSDSLSDCIAGLNLVPVAISYELDPCDALKASELYARAVGSNYEKAEDEDLNSIALGIAGEKGRVHLSIGEPLRGEFSDADAVAAAVDAQIVALYRLHSSNIYAWEMSEAALPDLPEILDIRLDEESRTAFQQRIAAMPEAHREYALAAYCNPIRQKLLALARESAAGE